MAILRPPEGRVTLGWVKNILRQYKIDPSSWGEHTTHPITRLVERMNTEQIHLEENEGVLILVMHVVNVRVEYEGKLGKKILYEEKQIFHQSDDEELERGFPRVAETALKDEDEPIETAKRALAEELGRTEPRFKNPQEYGNLKFLSHGEKTPRTSKKWPPLQVRVVEDWFELSIGDTLYREQYRELQRDKLGREFKTAVFGWRTE